MAGNTDNKSKINIRRDLIYIAVIVVIITAISLIFGHSFSTGGDRIRVEIDGQLMGEYPLDADMLIPIPNENETTNILSIEDHHVRMIEADCPDKLCIHQGSIDRQGQTIVCLPNRVVVTVVTDKESDYDVIAR